MVDSRLKNILKILISETSPVNRKDMASRLGISESTLRNIIKDIPKNNSIFEIEYIKGQGYSLNVISEAALSDCLSGLNKVTVLSEPSQRLAALLFYLLQEEGYIAISVLEEKLQLSRSTIVKELKKTESVLAGYNMKLERKAHYGIKVCGNEEDLRRAFSHYVLGSEWYLEPTLEYKNFMESIDTDALKSTLREGLLENAVSVNDVAFDNILIHLKILTYRASKRNFIHTTVFKNQTPLCYRRVANFIISRIEAECGVSFPVAEEEFLATHISSKANATQLEIEEKEALYNNIDIMLSKLDKEFLTSFKKDSELRESLLLHMFPMLNRLYYNFKLTNPLIEEVYTQYANVFTVSLRFTQLIEEIYGAKATRDETGYLAFHFAVHFERSKLSLLSNLKRIVVVCTTGGGSANLLRLKLERMFSSATIITTSQSDLEHFSGDLPDLFLSTIPIADEYMGIPIIHIKKLLDEEEEKNIKDLSYLRLSGRGQLKLKEFFYDIFFRRVKDSYLDAVKSGAEQMVVQGYAADDFPRLVLEREEKFTTIYQNGIAGPHSMTHNAAKNCIGVTILENPASYMGRQVQLIFLINLMPGSLFLHKEISRLLLYLIDNEAMRRRLYAAKDFRHFMNELDKIL